MDQQSPGAAADLIAVRDCCKLLGTRSATLYTYVSRALITPLRQHDRKQNRYPRARLWRETK